MCRFSPDGAQLATSSWSGLCRLWSVPDCKLAMNLRGHTAPACCIVWHPQARLQPEQQLALASSAQVGYYCHLCWGAHGNGFIHPCDTVYINHTNLKIVTHNLLINLKSHLNVISGNYLNFPQYPISEYRYANILILNC